MMKDLQEIQIIDLQYICLTKIWDENLTGLTSSLPFTVKALRNKVEPKLNTPD